MEKITKHENISTKSQFSKPERILKKQNESEKINEEKTVDGIQETKKEVISDSDRHSKIFAESFKIMNFTTNSKNLLERSAISISSDELNSEALSIQVSIQAK